MGNAARREVRAGMIALITGDDGFIGTNLKALLAGSGVEARGFSRKKGMDVLKPGQVMEVAKGADIVFHVAADARPAESVLKPVETIEANLRGSLNVLEACRRHDIPLVYPSSCEIYGDSRGPITEESPLNPPNPYSASKAAVDRICFTYWKSYGLDVKVARFFNPYGPHQQLSKIIPTFYFQAVRGTPLTVYGAGYDTRDYTYASDIAEGLWECRRLKGGEAVNICTGVATTNLEMAKAVIAAVGSRSEVRFVPYPEVFGGIKNQVGSGEKAKRLLGWAPKVGLGEGLRLTIDWLRKAGV
jgi:nucleoside-diphosphate-sugar epimerase